MYGRRKLGRVKQSQVPSQTSVGIHYIVDIDDMDTDDLEYAAVWFKI